MPLLLYEQRQEKEENEKKSDQLVGRRERVTFNCIIDVSAFESGSEIMLTVPGKTGMAGAAAAFTIQTCPCDTELPAGMYHAFIQRQPLTAGQVRERVAGTTNSVLPVLINTIVGFDLHQVNGQVEIYLRKASGLISSLTGHSTLDFTEHFYLQ